MSTPMDPELIIPVIAIAFSFTTPIIIICTIVYLDFRKKGRMFNTIDLALEHGKEIPISLLEALEKPRSRASTLHRGLVWCGLGVGILVAWSVFRNFNEASLGFIPLFIGLAYLVIARLEPSPPSP